MQTLIWNNLTETEKQQALTRPAISASSDIKSAVENIVNLVKTEGDKALFELTAKFDKTELKSLVVSKEQIEQATKRIPDELKQGRFKMLIAISKRSTKHKKRKPSM